MRWLWRPAHFSLLCLVPPIKREAPSPFHSISSFASGVFICLTTGLLITLTPISNGRHGLVENSGKSRQIKAFFCVCIFPLWFRKGNLCETAIKYCIFIYQATCHSLFLPILTFQGEFWLIVLTRRCFLFVPWEKPLKDVVYLVLQRKEVFTNPSPPMV